jgi:hypothetical protein
MTERIYCEHRAILLEATSKISVRHKNFAIEGESWSTIDDSICPQQTFETLEKIQNRLNLPKYCYYFIIICSNNNLNHNYNF